MKIYFANNKYLITDTFNEEYRNGFRHLNFNVNNSSLSFESIFNFMSNKDNLSHIIIVNNNNEPIATFDNIYYSVYSINRSVEEDGVIHISVQLSSSENGMENFDDMVEQ